MECFDLKNVCSSLRCGIRPVGRQRYNIFFQCNLTRPIKSLHVHAVLNHKHSTNIYQKYLIDLWEDFCAFLDGNAKPFLLDAIYKNIRHYTNVNHSCPYDDSLIVSMNNFTSTDFIFEPLLPAGRFRADFDFTESRKKRPIFAYKFYFSVSDHRLWHWRIGARNETVQ